MWFSHRAIILASYFEVQHISTSTHTHTYLSSRSRSCLLQSVSMAGRIIKPPLFVRTSPEFYITEQPSMFHFFPYRHSYYSLKKFALLLIHKLKNTTIESYSAKINQMIIDFSCKNLIIKASEVNYLEYLLIMFIAFKNSWERNFSYLSLPLIIIFSLSFSIISL